MTDPFDFERLLRLEGPHVRAEARWVAWLISPADDDPDGFLFLRSLTILFHHSCPGALRLIRFDGPGACSLRCPASATIPGAAVECPGEESGRSRRERFAEYGRPVRELKALAKLA